LYERTETNPKIIAIKPHKSNQTQKPTKHGEQGLNIANTTCPDRTNLTFAFQEYLMQPKMQETAHLKQVSRGVSPKPELRAADLAQDY